MLSRKLLAAMLLGACISAGANDDNNAAFVDTNAGLCGLLDGESNFVVVSDSQIVSSLQGGEAHFRCQGKVARPSSGKAVLFKDVPCGVVIPDENGDDQVLITYDAFSRVSASGNATLTCHFSS